MLRYMLDTNILIYTVKNRPQVVQQNLEAHESYICTSSITAMELLYGAHKSQAVRRNLDVIEALLERIEVLDFDLGAAEHAGQIRAELAEIEAWAVGRGHLEQDRHFFRKTGANHAMRP